MNKNANVPKDLGFKDALGVAWYFFTIKTENRRPAKNLEVIDISRNDVAISINSRLLWFGHSSFLLQLNGKNIFIDPMLTAVAAPHPWLGANRFNAQSPLDFDEIPDLDAIIISHDHYDHLDHESILQLKDRTTHFYVPLGVGVHLESWGINSDRITELDWWQETSLDDIQLVCTPLQHFSGRKLRNGQSTLWSSWVIKTDSESLFFSGDSGYADHFKEIGEKYGPFDLALMECGQYDQRWSDIHMLPEQTAQAGVDVKADVIMPIHWGSFKLALHSWKDPIQRVTRQANTLNLPVITPQIGEWIPLINTDNKQYNKWYEEIE